MHRVLGDREAKLGKSRVSLMNMKSVWNGCSDQLSESLMNEWVWILI